LADTRNENLCNMNLAQISGSLIFITTITTLTGEKLYNCSNPDIYLPYCVIPVHYHIKLHIEKYFNLKNEYDSLKFIGESYTTINILQLTKNIKLNGLNLFIINPITAIKNNIIYALKESSVPNDLKFYFSDVLYPGLYTLKIKFFGYLIQDSTKEKTSFSSFFANNNDAIAWVNIKLLKIHIDTYNYISII